MLPAPEPLLDVLPVEPAPDCVEPLAVVEEVVPVPEPVLAAAVLLLDAVLVDEDALLPLPLDEALADELAPLAEEALELEGFAAGQRDGSSPVLTQML